MAGGRDLAVVPNALNGSARMTSAWELILQFGSHAEVTKHIF